MFCLESFMNSKSLVRCFAWNHQCLENFEDFFLGGCTQEFYHRFLCTTPSCDHSWLTLKLPFKIILRKFEVVFLIMSGVRMYFSKDWWKFTQIHEYLLGLYNMHTTWIGNNYPVNWHSYGCSKRRADYMFQLYEHVSTCSMTFPFT